jgi:hypothetical protein
MMITVGLSMGLRVHPHNAINEFAIESLDR